MAESKTKEQKYEDLLFAVQQDEMGMAKFLWDLLERVEQVEGCATSAKEKVKDHQKCIDDFILAFKDRKDGKPGEPGKTPTNEQLLALIRPLIKPGPARETPSDEKLIELIESVLPDPIPGPPGKPGKPGEKGKPGKMPAHEWNGTFIRFQNPDESWGEWKNLQGPPGVQSPAGGVGNQFGSGALERVRSSEGFEMQGVSQIYFGDNLIVTKVGANGIRVDAQASGSLQSETPVGDVDDSNVEFTVANEPKYIVVNGAQYFVGTGAYVSYNAGVITLAYAVGTGGFIRSVF